MNVQSPAPAAPSDPRQKRRLVIGVGVFIGGWILAFALVPVVGASNLSVGMRTALTSILLLGLPKVFLVLAAAIMGKPGFTYLKTHIASHVRRYALPAEVSVLRYRIGLTLFVSLIVLSSLGRFVGHVLPGQAERPWIYAIASNLLLVASVVVLGGDFWDKLRALFMRDAKAVFPKK